MDQPNPNFPASVEQLKQSVDNLSHQVDQLYGQAAAMAVQHTGAEQTFLVMGITVLYGALILFLNLLVDLGYAALDPRVGDHPVEPPGQRIQRRVVGE